MYNISRYILFENGSQTATTLAKYLGGSQGYNSAAGGTAPEINGTSLKEAASMYCLMTVYNVGMQNLEAHRNMGMDNVDAYEAAFKLAIAQIYYNNDGLTAGDQSLIDAAGDALTIPEGQPPGLTSPITPWTRRPRNGAPGTNNRPCCNWQRWRRWPAAAAQPERAVRFGPPSQAGSAKPAPRFTTSCPGSRPKWPLFSPKARCKRFSWAGC